MGRSKKARDGKFRGELRTRFNNIEQWDGKQWREPEEVGVYDARPTELHFDVADALHTNDDAVDRAFRPR